MKKSKVLNGFFSITYLLFVLSIAYAGEPLDRFFNPLDGTKLPEIKETKPEDPGESMKLLDSEVYVRKNDGRKERTAESNFFTYSQGDTYGYNRAWMIGDNLKFSTLAGGEWKAQGFSGYRDGMWATGASIYEFCGIKARQELLLPSIEKGGWKVQPTLVCEELLGEEFFGEAFFGASKDGVKFCTAFDAFVGGKIRSLMGLSITDPLGAGFEFAAGPYAMAGYGASADLKVDLSFDGLKFKTGYGLGWELGGGTMVAFNVKLGKYGEVLKQTVTEFFNDPKRRSTFINTLTVAVQKMSWALEPVRKAVDFINNKLDVIKGGLNAIINTGSDIISAANNVAAATTNIVREAIRTVTKKINEAIEAAKNAPGNIMKWMKSLF